jgi:hypothetical protein
MNREKLAFDKKPIKQKTFREMYSGFPESVYEWHEVKKRKEKVLKEVSGRK